MGCVKVRGSAPGRLFARVVANVTSVSSNAYATEEILLVLSLTQPVVQYIREIHRESPRDVISVFVASEPPMVTSTFSVVPSSFLTTT